MIDTLRVQLARLKRMEFGEAFEKLSHEKISHLELALDAEGATVSARRVDPATLDRPLWRAGKIHIRRALG